MSSRNLATTAHSTKRFALRLKPLVRVCLFVALSFVQVTVKAWEIDLSRRKQDLQKLKGHGPEPAQLSNKPMVDGLFQSLEPTQEIVILHTDKGFIPETVRLRKGNNYRISIVNVNEKEKNTSFILDAFSEHHGTYFGQPKSFEISPKVEGVFSYQCPETAKQGKIVVLPDGDRKPANE